MLRLQELSMIQRCLGHNEFRLAAMRYFTMLGLSDIARMIGTMEVDPWLTPQEIDARQRVP